MSYYLVRCTTMVYNVELTICLTHTQFNKLKHKLQNNLIKYKVPIAHGSDSEDDLFTITDYISISKSTYNQIKDFLSDTQLLSSIENKIKLSFWYTKQDDSAIVDDFIKNKLNMLEHPEYEFIFSCGGVGTIDIKQKFGKIVLSNSRYKQISGFNINKNEIMNFLIDTSK